LQEQFLEVTYFFSHGYIETFSKACSRDASPLEIDF
jgi:hypothetical protein